jgi:hypothetical protein
VFRLVHDPQDTKKRTQIMHTDNVLFSHSSFCLAPQARQESAAKAVLEAAKKAGSAGELLSKKDLQQIYQQAINPPKEQPAKVRGM